jgi:hypothetical protein
MFSIAPEIPWLNRESTGVVRVPRLRPDVEPIARVTALWLDAPSIGLQLSDGQPVHPTDPAKAYRTPRFNQWDIGITRPFRIREKLTHSPTFQSFNLLNSNAAESQTTAVALSCSAASLGVAPFLTPQQCAGSTVASFAQCGPCGNISTITSPRLVKLPDD